MHFRTYDFPIVGTFHSVAVFFLRRFIGHIGYAPDFVIFDEDDRLKVVRKLLQARDIDEKKTNPRTLASLISQAKNNNGNIRDITEGYGAYFQRISEEIFNEYTTNLKSQNALDFDDILLCFRAILDVPEVISWFHNRFTHFLVDEYQDTNRLQYEIMRLLSSQTRNLSVVGDDWQGIYGWRGANIRNILDFERDFPDARIIKLECNYRSTKTIIAAANAVIKHNRSYLDKTLWTDNPQGEHIVVFHADDERKEANAMIDFIKKEELPNYAHWAILYRTNSQSRMIEEALIRASIPYRVYGGMKFYERKEIKDILAYLRLLANPLDRMSLDRIINVPSRKIGEKSVEILFAYIDNFQAPFNEVLEHGEDMEELSAGVKKSLSIFLGVYKNLRDLLTKSTVAEVMLRLIALIDYESYLKAAFDKEDAETKMDNVKEFLNMATRYDGIDPSEALQTFLQDIALITDQDVDSKQSEVVSLMTVHLSKGLEFENVIIAGVEEGIFPHARTLMKESELEEERRLMYVAMTRAKKRLFITHAEERFSFGNYVANPPSRFIDEIPKDTIIEERPERQMASSLLSGIRLEPTSSFTLPKKVERPKNDVSHFKLGDRVEHPLYGIGTIVSLVGSISGIAFGSQHGLKKFNIEIAPVKKV
jgi:DNA helicase-2/ATP-dependent DNA helicase PcrA